MCITEEWSQPEGALMDDCLFFYPIDHIAEKIAYSHIPKIVRKQDETCWPDERCKKTATRGFPEPTDLFVGSHC